MSTHVTAPNYTQIPNVIFDHWMNLLSPAEFKVLLCICRKTFGWFKDSDLISLKQIEKMTGLVKSGICQNIEKLESLGLVKKIKNKTSDGDDAPNRYAVVVHSVGGGSPLSEQQVVHSVNRGVVHSVDTQKKDYTKETTTTTTDAAVVAVSEEDFEKNEKIVSSLSQHLFNHSEAFGRDWCILPSVLSCLAQKYGLHFLIDQVNYMIAKQQRANRDESTMKKNKTNKIDNPLSYLRMACENNWGMSEKGGGSKKSNSI